MSSNYPKTNPYLQRITDGERFVYAFYRLIQTFKIHKVNNPILIKCIQEFITAVLQWCNETDHLKIQVSQYRFYLQDEKLFYRPQCAGVFYKTLDFFNMIGVEGLRIYDQISDVSFKRIVAFIRLLKKAKFKKNPPEWLADKLTDKRYEWVELIHGVRNNYTTSENRKEMGRRTYASVLASVKEVSQKLKNGSRAGIRKPRRMIQNLIDLMAEDEPLFLCLSTVRIHDDYTYQHSVNVAILSMCLGKYIGISRNSLEELGLCGLLHDLGKIDIPQKIIAKPGKLTSKEYEEIKKHPMNSVCQIVKIKASLDHKIRMIIPPFEHHLKYDLSGYPQSDRKKPLSLFSRIIAITDFYDALTSPRSYRNNALSHDEVLSMMIEKSGQDFDPVLLKVFIKMLGLYPAGTIVQLDGGQIGMVINAPNSIDYNNDKPYVILLKRNKKGEFLKGRTIDLSKIDPATGYYKRHIIRTLHPSTCGIQPLEFIL